MAVDALAAPAGGEDGYPGSFIERYLLPVIYPAELTRELQLLLGLLVLAVNFAVYGMLWIRQKNKRKNSSM